MKYLMFGLIVVTLVVLTVTPAVYAQSRDDADGDGLPDLVDKCPNMPGPRENNGCPLDLDKDGLNNDVDDCPIKPGPRENGGCPVSDDSAPAGNGDITEAPPIEIQPFTPAQIAANLVCSVAANHPDGVNVRANFFADAPIVGVLDPQQTYPIEAIYIKPDNEVWYKVINPAGFVLSDVVVRGGQCAGLPEICVIIVSEIEGREDNSDDPQVGLAPSYSISPLSADAEECEANAIIPPNDGPVTPYDGDLPQGDRPESLAWLDQLLLSVCGLVPVGFATLGFARKRDFV